MSSALRHSILELEHESSDRIIPLRRMYNDAVIRGGGKSKFKPIYARCDVACRGRGCGGDSKDTGVTGTVWFCQVSKSSCMMQWRIEGLAKGLHGFHIHEFADFSRGCASAGGHYNPFNKLHGGATSSERHVGDLGNIKANAHGVAAGFMKDTLVKLYGKYTVVGRSIMVHADPDDLGMGGHETSHTTGNAGARLACGEIVLSTPSVHFEVAPASSGKKMVAIFDPVPDRGWQTRKILFGARGYSDFTIHKDVERRGRYRTRHDKDLNSAASKNGWDPRTPGYLSYYVLWGDSPVLSTAQSDFRARYEAMLLKGNGQRAVF